MPHLLLSPDVAFHTGTGRGRKASLGDWALDPPSCSMMGYPHDPPRVGAIIRQVSIEITEKTSRLVSLRGDFK